MTICSIRSHLYNNVQFNKINRYSFKGNDNICKHIFFVIYIINFLIDCKFFGKIHIQGLMNSEK